MFSTRRLARWSATHPWTVILAWIAAFITSIVLTGALLSGALTTQINFLTSPDSQQGRDLIASSSLGANSFTETVIVQSDTLTVDDPAFQERVESLTAELVEVESVRTAINFYSTGDPNLVSADRDTAIIPVALPIELKDDVELTQEIVAEANGEDGFRVLETGEATLDLNFNEASEEDLLTGESIGLAVAFVILLVVFGALVASLVPILSAIISIVVGLGIVSIIGQFFDLSFFVTNMMVMMGLAVGIDYSLFILSRYKEERENNHDKLMAIEIAGGTASKAVLFSGLTVVFALAGLLIVPNTIFGSLGVGAIVVVFMTILQALTLLPAVIGLAGDRVFSLRIPLLKQRTTQQQSSEGFWAGLARTVMRRPAISLIAATTVLVLAALPLTRIETGFSGVSTLPDKFEAKEGFIVLGEEFSAGQSGPVQIVIDAPGGIDPAVERAAADLGAAISADEGFGPAGPLQLAEEPNLALLAAPMAGDPSSEESYEAIRRLREELVPQAFAGVDAGVFVTGRSAGDVDFIDQLNTFLPIEFAFILILSFFLLLLAFRSIVIPLKSIALNLLSVAAAYGLLVLVIQLGVGNEIFGFEQADQIEPWIPLFLFAVLFGLSMDYQVFLVSRIQEKYLQTEDNREAVAWGVGTTARLITGAALIMVAVFGGFALGQLVTFQQMGFGLAVAILIDATIVRAVLVPAAMTLLDRWNWYLPAWLDWIPDVGVEGDVAQIAAEVEEDRELAL